ncbi:SagB/ThcOx family dehydrogenase [Staphylococcus pseudintermedius]|uniref:SagB/ThcOx family dehydrogenase n=1 Tax=Staphylococcus pseudintermedius TaxID=283734 RepID=UPI0035C16ACF
MNKDKLKSHTTNLMDVLYGNEELRYDDISENWFEATKIYRPSMGWDAPGVNNLLRSPILQEISTRAGKKYDDLPLIPLKKPLSVDMGILEALQNRYSTYEFNNESITFEELSSLLFAAYGVIQRKEGLRRTVPSGGALYPLDIYILVNNVNGLKHGVYHFDPYRDGIIFLHDFDNEEFYEAMLQKENVEGFAFGIVIGGSFWRSRFKYGHRSYRFSLIESGHVMQNLDLVATALNLKGRPYGGFIDDELTKIVGVYNGVDEAPLYVFIGGK